MGPDGADLSCPGSSVVAEDDSEEKGFKNEAHSEKVWA